MAYVGNTRSWLTPLSRYNNILFKVIWLVHLHNTHTHTHTPCALVYRQSGIFNLMLAEFLKGLYAEFLLEDVSSRGCLILINFTEGFMSICNLGKSLQSRPPKIIQPWSSKKITDKA